MPGQDKTAAPTTQLSKSLWPIHLRPKEDELLSSWLVRLAMAHGMKLHTFCSVVWPGKQIWNRDIDKCADAALLDILSQKTAVSRSDVTKTTLAAYEGYVYERHNPNGNTLWIMPLGVYHRTRTNFGLQYCPKCLFEDDIPYYRRRWRLGFITCCETHAISLLDRCSHCGASVNFHRDEMGDRHRYSAASILRCYDCRFDLRQSQTFSVESRILKFQSHLTEMIENGWTEIPHYGPIYSHLYFSVLHQIMKLLATGKKAALLRAYVSDRWKIDRAAFGTSTKQRAIENLPVQKRQFLVNLAGHLLAEWPTRFVQVCTDKKIWSSVLLKDFDSPPFWYWSVIHDYLYRLSYQPSDEEVIAAITHLKSQGRVASKKSISKVLGAGDVFRKRDNRTNFDF